MTPPRKDETVRPSPHELWTQAEGDRDRYLALMREHGHIIPGKRPPGTDVFGHPQESADPREAVVALRRWVLNEAGVTGEGAWTAEFDRLLADALAAASLPSEPEHESWCYRRHTGDCVDGPSEGVAPLPSDTPAVHVNTGRAHDDAMAWSRGHTDGYDEALRDVHRVWVESGEREAFAFVYGSVNRPNVATDDARPSDTPADGLDAAWREAEAALPEDGSMRIDLLAWPTERDDEWVARVTGSRIVKATGNTPAEALRNLAAALTQEPRR